MDVHVPSAITRALRRRGVDVLTAQDDGSARLLDSALLDRAGELGRIVFTRDADFLAEGVRRQRAGLPFATIVHAHQQNVSIGRCVSDLEMIASASIPDEARGQIVHLPL
jgi:predicted nuclease of predicted toxin-antitoxin system